MLQFSLFLEHVTRDFSISSLPSPIGAAIPASIKGFKAHHAWNQDGDSALIIIHGTYAVSIVRFTHGKTELKLNSHQRTGNWFKQLKS